MKTIKYLTMAALALMMTACSSDDTDIITPDQPAKAEGIPFSATITVDNGATTRALAESGTTIEATWADGEKVALIYTVGSTAYKTDASVKAQGDGTATISATLQTGVATGDDVTIIYPASAADGTTGNVISNLLAAQDGTLTGTGGTSIAEKYDVRTGTGKLSISDGKATVNNGTPGTPVTLTNQNAIFKLTLKNIDATADVSATSVVISDQTGATLTTVTPAAGCDKVMYVALPTSATTLKFLVTGPDSKKYFNMASGLTLGTNFYQSTVKLATVGNVIASNGKCYKDDASTPGGNTAVAMIVYLGSETGESAYNYTNGLALAMNDVSNYQYKWKTSGDDSGHTKQTSSSFTSESGLQYNETHNSATYPAFQAAINYTPAAPIGCSPWFLASGYQWVQMINGYGHTNLKTYANGYSGLYGFYWTSSEESYYYAWVFKSMSGSFEYLAKHNNSYWVRACLAF